MKGKIITKEIISAFHKKLNEEEKAATVEKYLRDGHLCERIAIHHRRSRPQGRGNGLPQRKDTHCLSCKRVAKETASLHIRAAYYNGRIFVTRTGKPMSRTNIWREMKNLCKKAKVDESKVFPHNLRHLFAKVFYALKKDIAKLADILGHSSIETTRIYIISSGSEHRRLMETMRLVF